MTRTTRTTRVRRRTVAILAIAPLVAIAVACGGDDDDATAGDGSTATESTEQGTLTVYADESLTDAFTDIGLAFVSQYEDIVPKFTFGMSDELATELASGTPSGVFASSAAADVERVATEAGAGAPVAFASNDMIIAVPAGNPAGVRGLEDLTNADVSVVLCVAESACGQATTQLLDGAGITITPAQEAPNAGAALDAVLDGSADAGLVFVSDVEPNGGADTVRIVPDKNIVVSYVIASISADPDDTAGQAFVDFVTSETGQSILAENNFGPP